MVKRIELLDTLSPVMVEEFTRIPRTTKEVELLIDSDGGLTRRCRAIVATLRQLKDYGVITTAVVVGKAHSASFTILQACDLRRATPAADFMFHAPAILRFGKDSEPWIVDERNPKHDMHLEFLREFSQRTTLPVTTLQEWADQERHFTSDEALQNRFIDEIVDPSRYGK